MEIFTNARKIIKLATFLLSASILVSSPALMAYSEISDTEGQSGTMSIQLETKYITGYREVLQQSYDKNASAVESFIAITGVPLFGPITRRELAAEKWLEAIEDTQAIYAGNRRNAACDREKNIMAAVVSTASAGNPVSVQGFELFAQNVIDYTSQLAGGVKDPRYMDPIWRKMFYIARGSSNSVPFEIEIHYWWNSQTYAVEDQKFKNDISMGCNGLPVYA